jgi:hypothetical protein
MSGAFLIEKPPNRFLHLLRLRSRSVTFRDWLSNHYVIRAEQERFFDGDGPFLVI